MKECCSKIYHKMAYKYHFW